MTAKIAEICARTFHVDQFALATTRPRLGTWSIVTSRVEGTKHFCCLVSKESRITGGVSYPCMSVVSYLCTAMSEDRLPSRRVRQRPIAATSDGFMN